MVGNIAGGSPGDATRELCKALVEGQQLPKSCEAVAHHRSQVAHVVHQQPLHRPAYVKSREAGAGNRHQRMWCTSSLCVSAAVQQLLTTDTM